MRRSPDDLLTALLDACRRGLVTHEEAAKLIGIRKRELGDLVTWRMVEAAGAPSRLRSITRFPSAMRTSGDFRALISRPKSCGVLNRLPRVGITLQTRLDGSLLRSRNCSRRYRMQRAISRNQKSAMRGKI